MFWWRSQASLVVGEVVVTKNDLLSEERSL